MASAPVSEQQQAITAAEAARLAAMIDADFTTLRELLDESLSFIHSTGRRDTKESLLEFLASGSVKYLNIEHDLDPVSERSPCLAVVAGSMRMRLISGGVEKIISTRTTNAWVRSDSHWKLMAFQATTLPPARTA